MNELIEKLKALDYNAYDPYEDYLGTVVTLMQEIIIKQQEQINALTKAFNATQQQFKRY